MKNWKHYLIVCFMAFIIFTIIACNDNNTDNDEKIKFEGSWKSPFNDYNSRYIFNKSNFEYFYNIETPSAKGTFTFTIDTLELNFTHNWVNDQWSDLSVPITGVLTYNNYKDKESFVVINCTQNGSENNNFIGTWIYE